MFASVFGAEFGRHFHAVGVDVAEESERLLGHAVTQSGPANEDGGFHEGAGSVTQEDPVDGVVDGGFKAGAVEVDVVEIDVFFKAEVDGTGGVLRTVRRRASAGKQGNEAGVDGSQSSFVDDVGEAVAGAFGEGFDSFDTTDLQKPLKDVTVGKSDAEVAVVHAFKVSGDVATKGENTVAAEGFDPRCGGRFAIELLILDTKGDEVAFKAGGGQDFIDTNEVLTLLAVFFTALDFR